ncbi:3-isopropylmalate dehydratase large subunit [Bradyrhizobium iriomotense]|uniref:3-isopropylmalate dehydratase large subunit n=1 Tax=Bradyrhizobium iriomotense TaxID=441950 RepID=UPI001B8A3D71|nr:3-isopropylmalate dehydratase large subunit [Bradyrhizobium iriomotense]MBR1129128.1 3-isopropylmalate dehydratase large subunit [Bradyrhizobium iriomotense]
MPRTLFEKVWQSHTARTYGTRDLLTLDRVFLHDMTSLPAFETLRARNLAVADVARTLAVIDHTVATASGRTEETYPVMAPTVRAFRREVTERGIPLIGLGDPAQGIVHVVAAEQGAVLPGMTAVCGDSHTCTNGALGAIAFGIGSTEIAHALAYQALWLPRPKSLRVTVNGVLDPWVSGKDIALAIISRFSTDGGTGCAVEYAGSAIRALSVEERMTLCNLSIEFGARIGLVAPDDAVFSYLDGRPRTPKGAAFDAAVSAWRDLASDDDAHFDKEYAIDARSIAPMVSWGTSPEDAIPIDGAVPDPGTARDQSQRSRWERALVYANLNAGKPILGTPIDVAFIGSCTNARLSDLRAAARIVDGRKVAPAVRALVVPGSSGVKRQAEAEGLDRIFRNAGFEWHESACSLCAALGPDVVGRGKRCASTSNRNFENRQGPGSITHLMSPPMVAAAAVNGAITDVRTLARTLA